MQLLRTNAERYNGPQHLISGAAREIEAAALQRIASKDYSEQIETATFKIKYQD